MRCKHMYIPKATSKCLYRKGYCQKVTGMCKELKNVKCKLKEE